MQYVGGFFLALFTYQVAGMIVGIPIALAIDQSMGSIFGILAAIAASALLYSNIRRERIKAGMRVYYWLLIAFAVIGPLLVLFAVI